MMVRTVAAFCLVVTAAQAAGPQLPVSASIWQVSRDGSALHLPSQLQCPAAFADYQRDDLHNYDDNGLDVSCNYQDRSGRYDITLYITKSPGGDINAAFEGAKEAMVKRTADSVALPADQQVTFPSKRTWLHTINAIYGGKAHDGVWYTWMGDWMFEIRATFPADSDAKAMADIARMVEAAESTAGRHTELCAKSAIPVRDGTPITDETSTMAAALMLLAPGDDGTIPAQDEKGNPEQSLELLKPTHWCAEAAIEGFKYPLLLWHAVNDAGEIQNFDRVTIPDTKGLFAIDSGPDLLGSLFGDASKNGKPQFIVSLKDGDETYLYGLFAGRPSGKILASMLTDHVEHRGKPLAKMNPKTNTLSMFQDPKK